MTPVRKNYNQYRLPNLFDDFLDNDWMPKINAAAPAINVSEDEKAYMIEIAAPGMTKEDFKIYLSDNKYLIISIEKKNEKKEDVKKYLRREFSCSKFEQALTLPEDADSEKISAKVDDGILTIDIQKKTVKENAGRTQMIEIK